MKATRPKSIEYFFDYAPQAPRGLPGEQQEVRQQVSMFLNGDCPQCIKDAFVERIKSLESTDPNTKWVIGFIPAPNVASTIMRYGDLALEIGEKTECITYLDLFDGSGSQNDKDYVVNRERVEKNNVILIDALLSSGHRYHLFMNKVKKAGAKRIYGIVVAKTVCVDSSNEGA